jgi:hypothetical protein
MRCKLHVRGHGRVAVACDAADGAALEVCGVQLVRAERRPAVAVPQPRLLPHSAFGLDVRVEHDQRPFLFSEVFGDGRDRGLAARQCDQLRDERGHVARPLGAPRPAGPSIV